MAQLAHKWLEQAKSLRADVAAEEKLGWKNGAASIGYAECLEDRAAELFRFKPDAGQCNGQRVLPDNAKLTDPAESAKPDSRAASG